MRAIVNVATGETYIKGQQRLTEWCAGNDVEYVTWNDQTGLPKGSPTHNDNNYAFKAYAMKHSAEMFTTLLWCDASVIPIRSLDPLWEKIERDGYFIPDNGYSNYEWTCDGAYPALFPEYMGLGEIEAVREINRKIPHCASTAWGVSITHPIGRKIIDEWFRLAQARAFHGYWRNRACRNFPIETEKRIGWCGPPDVKGHRHDQTALSVIAWRLGCTLTPPPKIFAYKGGETARTLLVADGNYL
jgi:hypothetical protein